MVNTIRWYDRAWNTRAAIAFGGAALVAGVYYDGHRYWLTEQTVGTVQHFVLENGAAVLVKGFALPAGYSDPTGITGDGHNLYVACTFTDAGPPISVTRVILYFDKNGTLLKKLTAINSPTSVTIRDLDFDGHRLIVYVSGTATGSQIFLVDVGSDQIVYQSAALPRLPHAACFDGINHPGAVIVAGNYFGVTFDWNAVLLTGTTALIGQPFGCCLVHDDHKRLSDDAVEGEAIAMAFRA